MKATCGSTPPASVMPKPLIGEQRITIVNSFDWKAHYRETNNLLARKQSCPDTDLPELLRYPIIIQTILCAPDKHKWVVCQAVTFFCYIRIKARLPGRFR